MSFLGPSELRKLLAFNKIITNDDNQNAYVKSRVKQAAYELSLGNQVYRTDNKDKKVEILSESNRNIDINPGQFTLLMTDEFVNIPNDKLAFISIKAKLKLKGLVNVSGFHVDPGFKGKLLFSVYNAGPSIITLETKKAYFLIWFANLDSAAEQDDLYSKDNNHHQGQKTIDTDYLDALKRNDMASPSAILLKIGEQKDFFESEITTLKNSLENDIKEKNRKVLNNEYLIKLLIGICIVIITKYLFDHSMANKAIQECIFENEKINKMQKQIDSINVKIIPLQKVDSLIDKKNINKNVKSKR
ncbi:dCTP deaminase domain-containing protein [Flavobacterium lipolyticum]|uniref:Deoxycytidine triphosphate deaminase n=1 Tax=Flavobacterium lipolyticum TaxID=2893754 RepID=A0ABS8M3J8_9FLAO|nr:deoxycytidine triphosphate deaminase [Flavobacterium sp. F-126]MCC9018902.1 deoxycytidine triphosphate deaminase [Flavobacterium sp. F-126]